MYLAQDAVEFVGGGADGVGQGGELGDAALFVAARQRRDGGRLGGERRGKALRIGFDGGKNLACLLYTSRCV